VTEESICHAEEGPMRGPDEFKERQYHPFISAFPDLRVEVEAIIAQDDVVVVRWSASGTHTGDGLGFRPTHATASFRGITWIEVRNGKLREGWQSSNVPEVIRWLSTMASG
jgi:predicted ester cyclase